MSNPEVGMKKIMIAAAVVFCITAFADSARACSCIGIPIETHFLKPMPGRDFRYSNADLDPHCSIRSFEGAVWVETFGERSLY